MSLYCQLQTTTFIGCVVNSSTVFEDYIFLIVFLNCFIEYLSHVNHLLPCDLRIQMVLRGLYFILSARVRKATALEEVQFLLAHPPVYFGEVKFLLVKRVCVCAGF